MSELAMLRGYIEMPGRDHDTIIAGSRLDVLRFVAMHARGN